MISSMEVLDRQYQVQKRRARRAPPLSFTAFANQENRILRFKKDILEGHAQSN